MASGEGEIEGGKLETVTDCIFLSSEITVGGYYSHEIKTCLLLRRKAVTNPDSVLKSRDITLPTKVHIIKAMVFSVSCMDVRVRLQRKSNFLSAKELMF